MQPWDCSTMGRVPPADELEIRVHLEQRQAGQVDGFTVKGRIERLGRSIHVRGKGCAHDTTSSRRSVFPLSA